jgi:hypothetical protein
MRDVTPPWENEEAVTQWAVATLEREEKAEIEAVKREAAGSEPYRCEWPKGWSLSRYRKVVFDYAKRGEINPLLGYVEYFPLGDITLDERRIMMDVMSGKIERGRITHKSILHAGGELKFQARVMHVDRIRSILVRAYGHKKGVRERAASIAGLRGREHAEVVEYLRRKHAATKPEKSHK